MRMLGRFFCAMLLGVIPAGESPRNLIYNSSFELGVLKDWWGIYSANICFTQRHISEEEAVHGSRSLTLPSGVFFFTKYIKFDRYGEYGFSFFVKASNRGEVQLSLRARASSLSPGARERILVQKRFAVSRKWKRVRFTHPASEGSFDLLFYLRSKSGNVRFWLDAIEVKLLSTPEDALLEQVEREEGEEYSPAYTIEAGLVSSVPGHIFYHREKGTAQLNFYNHGARRTSASISYEIRDIYDKVVKQGKTYPAEIPPARLVSTEFRLPTDQDCMFSVLYRLDGLDGEVCEFVYSVIERPKENNLLGAHTFADEAHLSILERAGVRWYVALTDSFLRSYFVHPDPDKYVWDDERAERLRKYRMNAIGILGAYELSWAPRVEVKLQKPVLMRYGYFKSRRYYASDVWKKYIRTIVSHYKDIFHPGYWMTR